VAGVYALAVERLLGQLLLWRSMLKEPTAMKNDAIHEISLSGCHHFLQWGWEAGRSIWRTETHGVPLKALRRLIAFALLSKSESCGAVEKSWWKGIDEVMLMRKVRENVTLPI
jgi:hypothetical protein